MFSFLPRHFLILLIFSLASMGLQAEAKPNLVLLPIDVSESETPYESEYGSALQEGLQQRYTVFYGAAVENELEKEYGKIDCNTETCNQNVAIAFNGELIADGSVKAITGGYLLKLVVSNVLSSEVIETKTVPCRGCDIFSVIDTLKKVGAGTFSQTASISKKGRSNQDLSENQPTQNNANSRAILIFDSQPSGADVYLDGTQVGTTPYQGVNHKIGDSLNFAIKSTNYRNYQMNLSLEQAITQLESVILEAGIGKVVIYTEPYENNSVVYVNGQAKGVAPLELELPAGKHEIYAKTGGKQTAVQNILVSDGISQDVNLSFKVPGKVTQGSDISETGRWVTLSSGLKYNVLRAGSGAKPSKSDVVKVHYTGTFSNGEVFDSSVDRGQPVTFPVSGVIEGWTEALQLMREGAKMEVEIPSHLAYGEAGNRSIGPNETLFFEIELLEVM